MSFIFQWLWRETFFLLKDFGCISHYNQTVYWPLTVVPFPFSVDGAVFVCSAVAAITAYANNSVLFFIKQTVPVCLHQNAVPQNALCGKNSKYKGFHENSNSFHNVLCICKQSKHNPCAEDIRYRSVLPTTASFHRFACDLTTQQEPVPVYMCVCCLIIGRVDMEISSPSTPGTLLTSWLMKEHDRPIKQRRAKEVSQAWLDQVSVFIRFGRGCGRQVGVWIEIIFTVLPASWIKKKLNRTCK